MILRDKELLEFNKEMSKYNIFERYPYLEYIDMKMIEKAYHIQMGGIKFDPTKSLENQLTDDLDTLEIIMVIEKNIDVPKQKGITITNIPDDIASYIISATPEYLKKHNRYFNLKKVLK